MSSAQMQQQILDVIINAGKPVSQEEIAKALNVLRHQINSDMMDMMNNKTVGVSRKTGAVLFFPPADLENSSDPVSENTEAAAQTATVVSLRPSKEPSPRKPKAEKQVANKEQKPSKPKAAQADLSSSPKDFALAMRMMRSIIEIPCSKADIIENFGDGAESILEVLETKGLIASTVIINERVYELTPLAFDEYPELLNDAESTVELPPAQEKAQQAVAPEPASAIPDSDSIEAIAKMVEKLVNERMQAASKATDEQYRRQNHQMAQIKAGLVETIAPMKSAVAALERLVEMIK